MSSLSGPASSGASDVSDASVPRLAIIGCGNPARSDDGAGIEVIRLLARQACSGDVRLIDAGTSGMDVMFRVRGVKRVVIIDACRSGAQAGAIFRLPGREAMTPTEHGFSQHGLRWDHALYAGCKMFGDAFVDGTEVFLIEAGALDFGLELSAPVQRAAEQVAALLAPDLMAHHG